MTERKTNNTLNNSSTDYKKLSIQISLNGLSFSVVDTIDNTVLLSERLIFSEEKSLFELEKELKLFIEKHNIQNATFSEVAVIHQNDLFTLIPKALFNKNDARDYLKFNIKVLANDHIVYDEITPYELINAYVPFVNINNYIYDLFGEFEFTHKSSILIQSLLNNHKDKETVCYVDVSKQQLDITLISKKNLLYFNSFTYYTKEDFIYYLLFAVEQLKLDPDTIKVKLFGTIEENDALHSICNKYIKNISISVPENMKLLLHGQDNDSIDFSALNTL